MVGFWLFIGDVATPFSAWLAFAGPYLAIVALEPVFTLIVVNGLKTVADTPIVDRLFVVKDLQLAN